MERFNYDHYTKIYRQSGNKSLKAFQFTKKLLNLPEDAQMENNQNIILPSHPWVGKKIKNNHDVYTIEQVNVQFYGGWYYGLLLNRNGSHCFIYWQNISSINEVVLASIEKNQKFTILE